MMIPNMSKALTPEQRAAFNRIIGLITPLGVGVLELCERVVEVSDQVAKHKRVIAKHIKAIKQLEERVNSLESARPEKPVPQKSKQHKDLEDMLGEVFGFPRK